MSEDDSAGETDPQGPGPGNRVDLDFLQALPEPKGVALLAILTDTDFQDCRTFRGQVTFTRDALDEDPAADMAD
jgi:hypothetical protein